ILSNFLDNLVNISDKIEDAADVIQILNVSLR
ncbi:TIGR00153 family protein, partial [Archaeoglobales archaeon]